jgi:hypothetical protein
LQFSDLVLLGGGSHEGTHRPFPAHKRMEKQRPFPHRGCVVRLARSVLRPPPTPVRHGPLPGSSPVIGRRSSSGTPQSAGPGWASQFPPPPSARCAPPTPGSSSRLHSRIFTASVAFALRDWARLSLSPPRTAGTLTTRQASPDTTDRAVAPLTRLLTLGFDPARFHTGPPACYRASWQLPRPDSHRLPTTSLPLDQVCITSNVLGALPRLV